MNAFIIISDYCVLPSFAAFLIILLVSIMLFMDAKWNLNNTEKEGKRKGKFYIAMQIIIGIFGLIFAIVIACYVLTYFATFP